MMGVTYPSRDTEPIIPQPETALAEVTPETDVEVKSHYDQALLILAYAEKRVIASTDDLKGATNDLAVIAKLKKVIEDKRKEYVSPLQDRVKQINDAFKTFMEPITQADKLTRDKMLAYNAEQERKRQVQEEINRKRMEAAQEEMKLKGELTEPVDLIEVSEGAAKRVRTDMGVAGRRMVRKYRVIDFALLPDEYKLPNTSLLNSVVKSGIPSIPGVEIYEEPIITVTTK